MRKGNSKANQCVMCVLLYFTQSVSIKKHPGHNTIHKIRAHYMLAAYTYNTHTYIFHFENDADFFLLPFILFFFYFEMLHPKRKNSFFQFRGTQTNYFSSAHTKWQFCRWHMHYGCLCVCVRRRKPEKTNVVQHIWYGFYSVALCLHLICLSGCKWK